MKKRSYCFLAALLVYFFTGLQESKAAFLHGAELTYTGVASNTYIVECKIYRDCYSPATTQTLNLNIKSAGCNSGRTIPLNLTGSFITGQPYCAQIPAFCAGTSPLNYEEVIYRNTVTFSPTEMQCTDWTLSVTYSNRVMDANVVNSVFADFYIDAYLNLGSGMNNSAQFPRFTMPYVNLHQPAQLSTHAVDADGDSLVYSLVTPLTTAGVPMTYKSYPGYIVQSLDSTKYLPLPAGSFSAAFPIISYAIDWSQPMPLTAVKNFKFNTKTGALNFTPAYFKNNAGPLMDENKYLVKVKVDEYRKMSGVRVKVGSVSREMVILVFNTKNANPSLTTTVANGQFITENDVINLQPGMPLNFQFGITDPNATDVLEVSSDVSAILPGAGFMPSTPTNPFGAFSWTPTAAHVRNQPYFVHITVKDNACPVRGIHTATFAVKVNATGSISGTSEIVTDITGFSVFPNPFNSDLHFKLNLLTKAEKIIVYNLLGQKIDEIAISKISAGEQNIQWQNAGKYPAGTYVAKLISADKTVKTLKFTRL